MPRVVHVLTVADSLIFIDTLVRRAVERGFDVVVVTSPDERLDAFGKRLGMRTVGVEMPRRVAPLGDWVALDTLRRLFDRLSPDVVHAGTPKGGLLGTLAAEAVGVPVRLFQMRGLASVTAKGVLRAVLRTTEHLSCAAATRVICQSRSLREQAIEEGLVSPERSELVLEGSNGVDAQRFDPERHREAGRALRRSLDISEGDVVFGFVGRLVSDKGLPELAKAFQQLSLAHPRVRLVIAGPFEERDPVPPETRAWLEGTGGVHLLGPVRDPAAVYAASDVIVLPSHREGFPNVPLEAAAMGLPVIATDVAGCRDAVLDGETGLLVPVGDAASLSAAMVRQLSSNLRAVQGAAGRARALRTFSRERIADAMVDLYVREIASN